MNVPDGFKLEQNYPNPFNPSTKINFSVPNSMNNMYFRIKIFNSLGTELGNLFSGKLNEGEHSVIWNAENYPSGAYYCVLSSGNINLSKKMILLK